MLDGVNAKAVAIGDRYPIFEAIHQEGQRRANIQGEILEGIKIGPLVFCVWVLNGTASEVSSARTRVTRRVLEFTRSDAISKKGFWLKVKPPARRA